MNYRNISSLLAGIRVKLRIRGQSARTREKNLNSTVILLYDWTGTLIASLICVILAFIFFFRIVGVVGSSMNPTLIGADPASVNADGNGAGGDRLVIYTFMYKPAREDIVVVDRYTDDPLIKRVIAVAGDTIQLFPDTNSVAVNDVIIDEWYATGTTTLFDFGYEKRTVPPGHIVVFGDNRSVSKDSRTKEIDFVNVDDVIGKAVFRFAPFDRFGKL